MRYKSRILVSATLVAAVLAVVGIYTLGKPDFGSEAASDTFKRQDGIFECRFPKGWENRPAVYSDTPQAVFVAPPPSEASDTAAVPSMWVYFYAEGNPAFKDSETYILMHTLSTEDHRISEVTEVRLNERLVKSFWVERPLIGSPENTREVIVKEDYVVFDTDKGFFVLGLTWPLQEKAFAAQEKRIRSQFDAFLKSFRFSV
ncbi:MAG: hypothetical protein A3G41_06640 [Elusimicrobia bacterium RIFCSPLOWO2_12_FULL_59_9]|nr:MAG: hypothetical protein A3G41_06640 [Elusimicrobia bacterium RIFCSPLOWO2_12_FULL_59_9]